MFRVKVVYCFGRMSYLKFDIIPGKHKYINLTKETGMFIRGQPNSAVKLDDEL